jgi:glycosyltransferase involved in cell wall biosynthesis
MKKRLAIVTSHPIQYNAPLFEWLSGRNKIDIRVFYTWGTSVLKDKFDPGFGKVIEWDIPLLQGYSFEFLENIAEDKGSHHFNGIINPNIIDIITNYRPDVLLVYGWSFKSHLTVMRHFKNKLPVLFRGDSTLLDKSSFLQSLKRTLFLKWVYRHIDVALFTGKSNYQYFRKAGIKPRQLVFGPHAIDNKRFACESDDCRIAAKQIRSKLGIQPDELVFLFAGKIEPKKDPELLLAAFTEALFQLPVHLLMVGNGVLEGALKTRYHKHKNIHFLDFQNQLHMPSVYQVADVFVLPSRGPGETWGLSVNEAMANGMAVIVSDKCGCAEDLAENGMNGYVFSAGNKNELMQCLIKLAGDKKTTAMMGKNSFTKIQTYSLENLGLAIEGIVTGIQEQQ